MLGKDYTQPTNANSLSNSISLIHVLGRTRTRKEREMEGGGEGQDTHDFGS
jgi:hypothetical protein